MIRFLLNQFPACYGSYTAEDKKIRRTFSNGFTYIATECKSDAEAWKLEVKFLNTFNDWDNQLDWDDD